MERLSITDRLTGLFNRRKLDATLVFESLRAQRVDQPFSLIIVEVDHFKQVNDKHGHQAGDRVLIEVARLLQSNTRETDAVGHWGGEEFLVICPNTASQGACRLAENLRQKMQLFRFPAVEHQTASCYRPCSKSRSWRNGDSRSGGLGRHQEVDARVRCARTTRPGARKIPKQG